MSSDATPEPSDSTSPEPATPAKPPRSPGERIVVWGLILGLLAVCGSEAMARFGYEKSLTSLQAAIEKDEEGETAIEKDEEGEAVTVEEIDGYLFGFPSRENDEQNKVITYRWAGLLKTYGTINLPYSINNEVLGLETSSFEEVE